MSTIESTAEDITPVDDQPSTAVARRERRSEVIRPLNADDLVASFRDYQQLLPRLLDASDYQDAGRGERFVKKSGWRKIATAFDLDVQIIRSDVDRDLDDKPVRAEVVARAIAPSGRSMDGDGYCSVEEARFAGPRGNRSKLENDLRTTATTRAMNRAISGLVGMGAVSAEEVDAGPPVVEEASPDLKRKVRDLVSVMLDADQAATKTTMTAIGQAFGGHLPKAAGEAILLVANAVIAKRMSTSHPRGPSPEEVEEARDGETLPVEE